MCTRTDELKRAKQGSLFFKEDIMKVTEGELVARKVRELLRTCGPKTAKRFLDSRGGSARHESAGREIALHIMAITKQPKVKTF